MANRAQILPRSSLAVLIALLLGAAGQTLPLSASPLSARPLAPPPTPPIETSSPAQPDSPAVPPDWWTAVQADIAQAEYAVTWQDQTYLADLPAAYQAPNRAQGLRTYFTTTGPTIIPREWPEGAIEPPWRLDLHLDTWGRLGAMRPVETAAPEAAASEAAALGAVDDRVAYPAGPLEAWYLNEPEGLAMGLRLEAAPEGDADLPVRVAVAWGGSATAEGADGAAVFSGPDGAVVRLGAPTARDATGRLLDARLSVEGAVLVVEVDDAGATYPVEAVSVMMGPAELLEPSGTTGLPATHNWASTWGTAHTDFGFSVGTAGDVNGDGYSDVIVGAGRFDGGQTDEGKVFVYPGQALGLSYTAMWSQESGQAGARFGYSVATAGDVNCDGRADVIAGAPYYDHGEVDEGGAWVYHGTTSGLRTVPDFLAQSDQEGAQLGTSVAFAGDVNGDGFADVIVGGSGYDAPTASEGAAWVWHGSAGGVNGGANGTPANAAWHAESNEASAFLGISVATAGDVNGDGYADVIVGANQYGATDAGTALVWHGSGSGVNGGTTGTPANMAWRVTGATAGAHLGRSVATAGDVNGDGYADVIVGAPHYNGGQVDEGAAYVYLGSAAGLAATWDNADEGNQTSAWFGQSVACAGDVNGDGYADVVVGAPLYTNGQTEEGRAFLWYGSASGISATRDWLAEGNAAGAWYGYSVATAGDVNGDGYSDLVVGAYGNASQAGTVFVYHGGPDMPSQTANWTKRSNQEGAHFGWSVGTAGDVNGDGYADIIVGAPLWDAGQTNEGGVWIYRGAEGGLVSAPYWYKQSDLAGAQFGWSVGTAGDVNGDGYADIIVGTPVWNGGQASEGGAWVYHGSSSGVISAPAWYKDSDQVGAQFGYAVATAGDINDDGYADVIVGAPLMDHGQTDEGLAWLYLGSSTGLSTTPVRYLESDHAGAQFGFSVGTAGDVNADGYSDILVGAPYWEDDVTNEGRSWLYLGSAGGLAANAAWHAESNTLGAQLGYAVGTAGDVNGDGFADVIVGAPFYGDGGLSAEGKVWVFHGTGSGLNATAAWTRESGQSGAYYGYSVGAAGDVNGDGYADVIIGAPHMTGAVQADEGLARLYLGGSGGLEASYAWAAEGNQTLSWYGISVGGAGDVNGDGYADLVIGAKDFNDPVVNEGKVFVYYGDGRSGAAVALRQLDGSGNSVAPLGHIDSLVFQPSFIRRNPFGRGLVATYIEVKRLGTGFTGRDVTWEGFWSNPALGSRLSIPVWHLDWGTTYHWRMQIRYRPATTPWMPASRWMTIPWNGWNEEDLRTVGTHVFLPLALKE
ncbi:MAG: FG-GAP-like repeat-containing protein [Anaerolineae bacterium]|nr:FG-GAP-like repeat-containing protein [Anaerolineae bacterium]